MKPLTLEELSQLTKPLSRYFGDSQWGRNPVVRCDNCKLKTDKVVLKFYRNIEKITCKGCIHNYGTRQRVLSKY